MLITGATVWDGVSPSPSSDLAIQTEGGRITAVAPRAEFGTTPTDPDVVDATGLFVMPGLINAHEHLTYRYARGIPTVEVARGPVELTIHAVRVAALALSQGMTTVREMGGKHDIPLFVRDAIATGRIVGPKVLACNLPLAVTGGHAWMMSQESDGGDGFRRAARLQLKAGADFIKVMMSHDPCHIPASTEHTRAEVTADEARAAFETAHTWGKLAACHVLGSRAIGIALDAGADVLDHGHYLTPELAERMTRDGIYLTPTLSSYDTQTAQPRFERGGNWAGHHGVLLEGHQTGFAAAVEAGVPLLTGTDSVGSYAEEVALMRAAGVDAHRSLVACTSGPAAAFGLSDVGTIAGGKVADLVALPADPFADPFALQSPVWVIKEGVHYDCEALRYLEQQVPTPSLIDLADAR